MTTRVASPMDLGDIVSAAWILCLRHWHTLLPMTGLTWGAILVADIGFLAVLGRVRSYVTVREPIPDLPTSFASLLVLGLLLAFYNHLALVRYALESAIGEGGVVRRCYAHAARGFIPALCALLLVLAVFTLGSIAWPSLPIAVFLAVSWFFFAQICLAERVMNPLVAVRRSRAIVKGSWWRTLGILAGVWLLALLPSLATGLIRTNAVAPTLVLSALATAVAAPFLASAQTMLYLDLRLRKHEPLSLAAS